MVDVRQIGLGLYRSTNNNRYELTPEGRWYAVTSYIDGECPTTFTAGMATQVAVEMAKMHQLVANFSYPAERSWPGTLIEMTERKIAVLPPPTTVDQQFLRQIIDRYLEELANTDLSVLPFAPIHGDIMRENIKFKDGTLSGIFDFDDCRESYLLEDIAKSLLFEFESSERCLFGEDGVNAELFLQEYETVRTLTIEERRALPLFLTSRFLYQTAGAHDKATLALHLDRFRQHQSFFTSA